MAVENMKPGKETLSRKAALTYLSGSDRRSPAVFTVLLADGIASAALSCHLAWPVNSDMAGRLL